MPKVQYFKKTVRYEPPIEEDRFDECYQEMEDKLYPPKAFETIAAKHLPGGELVEAIDFAMVTEERLNTAVACFPAGSS